VSRVPLSDEETYVIFAAETLSNLQSLDGSKQQQILSRLLDIVASANLPSQFRHETIGSLDILTAGDQCRLYTKIVENIPEGNATYHLIFVLYIDDKHEYNQSELATYDPLADSFLSVATSMDDVESVEGYLEEKNALSAEDLEDLLS
jgi:hypothetical protein